MAEYSRIQNTFACISGTFYTMCTNLSNGICKVYSTFFSYDKILKSYPSSRTKEQIDPYEGNFR